MTLTESTNHGAEMRQHGSLTVSQRPDDPEPDLPLFAALDRMAAHEADLEDPDFDPARHVGALDATKANIRRKVDAIEAKLLAFKTAKAKFEERQKFWTARKYAVENNERKLKDYIRDQLTLHGYEKLTGNEFEARLMRNSQPTMTLRREKATAEDMLEFGAEMVRPIPARYEWNEDAIYEQALMMHRELEIERGEKLSAMETALAKLEYGQHVRFFAAKVDAVRKTRKGKS